LLVDRNLRHLVSLEGLEKEKLVDIRKKNTLSCLALKFFRQQKKFSDYFIYFRKKVTFQKSMK
jgi:hypothetical protein